MKLKTSAAHIHTNISPAVNAIFFTTSSVKLPWQIHCIFPGCGHGCCGKHGTPYLTHHTLLKPSARRSTHNIRHLLACVTAPSVWATNLEIIVPRGHPRRSNKAIHERLQQAR
jgi:hypothetical protein